MRAATSIATVAIALLLLSGCVPQPSPVTPTPAASSTPVFASDEEALAAATAAYAAYLAVSDQIGADGGANPERLKPFVTADHLPEEISQFESFEETGRHASGMTSFDSLTVQAVGPDSVTIYVCVDVNSVRILDTNEIDVTPPGRPTRVGLEVSFELSITNNKLLLSSTEVWGGESFCGEG